MAMETPDVTAALESWRAYRAAVDEVIAALEKVQALGFQAVPGSKANPASGDPVQPDSFFGMNATDAAKRYLAMCRRPQSIEQIEEALNRGGAKVTKASLFTILPRAAKGREVVKVGRSMWGLREWYKGSGPKNEG
jgi:hypothetical protein